MSNINFDNPWLLLLAIPIIALFAVPFFIAIRRDNVSGHNVASGIIHVVLAVIIAFAAAGTGIVVTRTQTHVYVLADVSYSANRNLDAIDGYIEEIEDNLPSNSQMAIICFGADYDVLTPLGGAVKSVKEAEVDDSATDIEAALDCAELLMKEGVINRIVLVTDGRQTVQSDPNALAGKINLLAAKGVVVDAMFVNDTVLADTLDEIQACSVEYTRNAYVGASEQVKLSIRCNCNAAGEAKPSVEGTATLYENGEIVQIEGDPMFRNPMPLFLSPGYNTVIFTLPTDTEGRHDYTVELSDFRSSYGEGGKFDDFNPKNNKISFSQILGDRGKSLLICKSLDDYNAVESVLGAQNVDAYVNDANVPVTVAELCAYDQIILSGVDASQLVNGETFLRSLDKAVSLFGKNLVTLGDTGIQNYNDDRLKILDDMLPVRYGAPDGGKLFAIVLDTSRSMMTESKMIYAKRAAKALVAQMDDTDSLVLISFNGEVFPLIDGDNVGINRANIEETIDNVEMRQGTLIGASLNKAYAMMTSNLYDYKKLFLISDGLNYDTTGTLDDPIGEVQELLSIDVSTSTFKVGGPNSNLSYLQSIAAAGMGTCYDISTEDGLEHVLESELPSVTAKPEGDASYVIVNRAADAVLKDVTADVSSSFIGGFYYARRKDNSTVSTVLSAHYINQYGVDTQAPLYAYRTYGRGTVSTFTSTVSGSWMGGWTGSNYMKNGLYTPFFTAVLTGSMPAERTQVAFLFDVQDRGGYAEITLTPDEMRVGAVAVVKVTAPDGTESVLEMAEGNSSFTRRYVLPATGSYTFEADYYPYGESAACTTAVYLYECSYLAEYDSFALYDAGTLFAAIGANGTVSTDGKIEIVNDPALVGTETTSLDLPLLMAAAVLFAVDIAVRKLKKEDIVSLFRRGKK